MTGETSNHAEPTNDQEPTVAGSSFERSVRAVLALLSVLGIANLLLTLAPRVAFPYPLEWMEGASLSHALRLAAGQPLYAAPSAEFIAYLYPPLGYVPFSLSTAVLGPSLRAARVGAVACLLVTLLCVARAAARLCGDARGGQLAGLLAGLLAAGTFALGFGYTGAFLDLVRVDGCFVMLLAAALERTLAGKHSSALWLLALSALAKQHGTLLFAAFAAALLWLDARRHAQSVLGVAVALGAALFTLQHAPLFGTPGYFARYVFELPASHGLEPDLLLSFLLVDLCVYLPALALAAVLAVRRGALPLPTLALLLSAVAVSALGRAHPGGHDNARLPAFVLLCVIGAGTLVPRVLDAARSRGARGAALALLAAQLVMLFQPPSAHAPTDARRFAELQRAMTRCANAGPAGGTSTQDGDTAALDYTRLGSRELAHTMALSDLRLGSARALAAQGTAALLTLLARPDAPAALAVGEHFGALDAVLARHYTPCARVPAPPPATGYMPADRRAGRPEQVVYTRLPSAP